MGKPKVKKHQRKPKRKVGLKQQRRQSSVQKKETQTKSSPFPFQSLPNELAENILSLLSLEDKKSARLVSSQWYQLLKKNVEFKIPLTRDTLAELRHRSYPMKELEVVLNRVDIPAAARFTSTMKQSFLTAKILSFMADDYVYVNDGVRALCRSNSLDGEGVMALIKACKNIHTLKFNFRFLNTFNMTSPLRLNNVQLDFLRTIQLTIVYGGHPDVSYRLLELKTPQLRNLEVERLKHDKGSKLDRTVYLAVQKFMGQNKENLKSLKLVDMLTNFTLPSSSNTIFPDDMLHNLGQLKLDSLEIQHRNSALLRTDFDVEDWDAADRIMDQKCLKFLKLDMVSNDIFEKSYILLANCRNTLTKLDLNVKGSEGPFDMTTLRQLTCLTNLTFASNERILDNLIPNTIKYLTWNAPVPFHWYSYNQTPIFPLLLKLTVGLPGPELLDLPMFCEMFFGVPSFFEWSRRTKLQLMTIHRDPQKKTIRPRRSSSIGRNGNYRNIEVELAHRLPRGMYKVTHDFENMYIAVQIGHP